MTQCPSKKKRISWKEKTEKQQKTNNFQHSASNIMTEQHERRQKTGGGGEGGISCAPYHKEQLFQ